MSNASANPNVSAGPAPQHLGACSFFGAIHGKGQRCGAIFTDVRHAAPRKLPKHPRELAFFALLLDCFYGECYGRQQTQHGPLPSCFGRRAFPISRSTLLMGETQYYIFAS